MLSHSDCVSRSIGNPNSILVRHKKFLRQLEKQKNLERNEQMEQAVNA